MENRQTDGWKRDKLGVMVPVGSGASWKEFLSISKDQAAKVANMLTRADLPEEASWWLFVATSLASYKDDKGYTIIDDDHVIDCANVCGASVGIEGKGRKQALMGMTQIIAPSVLAGDKGDGRRRQPERIDRERSRQQADEDNE